MRDKKKDEPAPPQTPPLFILAPPRSFTSVTSAMLGNHPRMFGLAETNLFAADTVGALAPIHRTRPRLQHGLLRSIAELAFGGQGTEEIIAARIWLSENADMATGDLLATLLEWAEGRILVEKSPLHVYVPESFARMDASFPHARYLHITRHPVATCRSVLRLRHEITAQQGQIAALVGWAQRGKSEEDPGPDQIWLEPHLRIMAFLDPLAKSRWMRLRGEDFLADPKPHLRRICKWLGVTGARRVIEAMMHPERSPFARCGPSIARYGNDPGFLDSPALRPFSFDETALEESVEFSEGISEEIIACARSLGYHMAGRAGLAAKRSAATQGTRVKA